MKTAWLVLAIALTPLPAQQPTSAPPEIAPTLPLAETPTQAATRTIEHDGQTFALANSTAARNVETDEYVVAGETIADWTQLLTVQRLTLSQPTAADDFLTYFRKRIENETGATLDVLKPGRNASVFVVRFPKSERNEEQVMICLSFSDRSQPLRLNVVQFALKPTRISVEQVELRIKSWRDQFLRQAQALADL